MFAPYVLDAPPSVALIGGGFIGPVHAEALRRLGVKIVGLLGSHPDRARPLAKKLGIPRVYGDLDDLLADPEVQAAHVASPNDVHYIQASRLLESGRHVLCEKPLALTTKQSKALVALDESLPKQIAAVNYNIRYYPLCQEMKSRVARGDIGRVLSIHGSYTQDWLLKATDYNWRVEPDGGMNLRAISDIGTHWMDLAQFVSGHSIESTFADLSIFCRARHKPIGATTTFGPGGAESTPVEITTEDHGSVLLRMSEGVRGSFHVSQMNAGRKNRLSLEIAGSEGTLAWDSESPNRLWIGRRDQPNELLERDPSLLDSSAARLCHYPGGHSEGFPDTFKQLCLDFYGAISSQEGMPPSLPSFADGHREVALCEAIATSAREGSWADVDP
jgi:predicted dehydrogenase